MNEIKVHEVIYRVELKSGRTYDLPEQSAVPMRNEWLRKNKRCVFLLGEDAVDGFDIKGFTQKQIASDIDVYVQNQPKRIRDKLEAYIKNKPGRNNITHVSNVIEAINNGEI